MVALQSLLSPQTLTRVVSRQAATSNWLLSLFGCQPGGSSIENLGHGREGSYHIYNNVRAVGQLTAPGSAAARRNPQGVGRVNFTYARMHDSVSMLAEMLHNLGRIDDPATRDRAGADMLRRQTTTLSQLASNFRLAMLVGTLRDSLYINRQDDTAFFDFAGGGQQIGNVAARMPSGNKSKLNMLGTGDIIDTKWSTTTADIPGHVGKINAAFQQLCGGHLHAVVCGTKVWNYVINNEHVAAVHGSATPPFVVLERDSLDPAVGATMQNVYRARLSVYPDVVWYITDEGLDIGAPGAETFTKYVGDSNALFLGHNPSDNTISCYEGSEPIAERDGGPESVKVGLASWSVKRSNPTSTDIFALDNSMIVNHVPASTAYATVEF
ncbi:hypothetical protein Pla52o_35140 [Novipirellula galeiformis]|uniref:Phage major capsid protein E n=1 Tax=Novipirellula galeiformis TaxID=2528004 RepID=A0A5C6CDW6_9BACT|nr:hypothetical protein [Novipirellula galeiformis]TWU22458.1 hypothetical protein Pla52o_35140 [Novipirellula galeiformis]